VPSVRRSIQARRVGGMASRGHVGLLDIVADVLPGPPAEHHQVEQAVGSQAVGAVNRYAGAFAGGVEAVDDGARAVQDHAPVDIRGDAAHGVMGRGQHRYGRVGRIDAQIGLAEAGDVGQFAAERFLSQMGGVQMNVVVDTAVAADSLTGPHLGENGTGDDVPGARSSRVGE
jgi:hypothetical protein